MQLFVRTLSGDTAVVQVGPEADVAAALGGAAAGAGRRLRDVPGLQDGSTVHAVPRLAGGGDGTEAMGKKNKKSHGLCIRCGKRAFHLQKKRCASCGYPATKIRSYVWAKKAKRRRAASRTSSARTRCRRPARSAAAASEPQRVAP